MFPRVSWFLLSCWYHFTNASSSFILLPPPPFKNRNGYGRYTKRMSFGRPEGQRPLGRSWHKEGSFAVGIPEFGWQSTY